MKAFAALIALSCLIQTSVARAQLLYISDGNTIKTITMSGTVSTFVSSGLSTPEGLAFDSSGNLYEADSGTNSILEISPGGTISTFVSGLNSPEGLAFDSSGNLYEADFGSGNIIKVTPGGTTSTFASLGGAGATGLAFDSSGNLFVSDPIAGMIREISPGGSVSTFDSTLNTLRPAGEAFDATGHLDLAIFGSAILGNFSGKGRIYTYDSGGLATIFATGLSKPIGLTFDSSGNLYEVDSLTDSVNVITSSGTVTSFATGFTAPTFITLTNTPEPSACAMLVGGLGLLGAVVPRRWFRS